MIDETTAIAQLVERTAFNRVVEGSSPSGGVDEDQIIPTAKSIYFDFFKNLVDNEKSSSNSVG
tara:strand:- start:22 stop:210 length:189 start_codon:yes stop_codon:yes gene_type:complete